MIPDTLPPDAMVLRGAFHPAQDDRVPDFDDGTPVATVFLLGWTGGRQWPAFAASAEACEGRADALDRWSRRLIDAAAVKLGALALYPFGGPPHHDFQRWALRAEPVARSPIGLLIHPSWGLWHAYRGALGFRQRIHLEQLKKTDSPCQTCTSRPCLSICPVAAFSEQGYDINACTRYLSEPAGAACISLGCAARRACPVRPEVPYSAAQTAFHMRSFMSAAVRGIADPDKL
jgi:hypothetical protein